MKEVSVIISGDEVEVDKVIRENSIRKEIGLIRISDKKDITSSGKADVQESRKGILDPMPMKAEKDLKA